MRHSQGEFAKLLQVALEKGRANLLPADRVWNGERPTEDDKREKMKRLHPEGGDRAGDTG